MNASSSEVRIVPLGGLGEIGALNCMVYETATEAVVVDCGSMFPDNETMGIDLIIPDFTYLRQIRHKLKALVLTHGHEDHIGATPFFLQEFEIPVYATAFTRGLIEKKLDEYPQVRRPRLHTFKPGEDFRAGSFLIESFFVNHSIIDATGLALNTPAGTFVHLTDWKIDKTPPNGATTDIKKMEKLAKKGVKALFLDSTNVSSTGSTLSEREVGKRLHKICSRHKGRIIVALFSSNIQRIEGLAKMARDLKRKLSLVGRSMKENTEIARNLGSLSMHGVEIVDVEETAHLDDDEVLVLATGTQGEPRSVLSRMAAGEFKPFKIREGDLILFSSKVIPGNEKNIFTNINHLCRHGARVLYESVHEIHTSGHAHQDELKTAIKKLKPAYFVPIHGDYRHLLKHAEFAEEWGVKKKNIFVVENGTPLLFDKKGGRVSPQKVPSGRVFVDGAGDVTGPTIRDRRHLSQTGIITCVLMINRQTGEVLRGPELITKGFVQEEENQDLLESAKRAVTDTLATINFEARTDMVEVQEEVRLSLRRFFNRELDRKPVVIPIIMEV